MNAPWVAVCGHEKWGGPCWPCVQQTLAAAKNEGAREAFEEAAQHFTEDAASCRMYGGKPCGPNQSLHSDAHDACHTFFEAASWCNAKAAEVPR